MTPNGLRLLRQRLMDACFRDAQAAQTTLVWATGIVVVILFATAKVADYYFK